MIKLTIKRRSLAIKRRSNAYTKVTKDHLHMTFMDNHKQRSVCILLEKKKELWTTF
jgi:hypothetical protein